MARLRELFEHPSDLMSSRQARRLASRATDVVRERPGGSIMGLVALVALIAGFIWLYPELRRYIRIERM
jgi:hypothetical protein